MLPNKASIKGEGGKGLLSTSWSSQAAAECSKKSKHKALQTGQSFPTFDMNKKDEKNLLPWVESLARAAGLHLVHRCTKALHVV